MKNLLLISLILSISITMFSCSDDDAAMPEPDPPTLVQAAQSANLSILLDAVGAVDGMANALLQAENITVFAPTNAAFESALSAFSANNLAELVEAIGGVENLEIVLGYHVLPQVFFASDIPEGSTEVQTLANQIVTINRSGNQVTLTDAVGNTFAVTTADVTIENGVVHVINGVLLPELEIETTARLLIQEHPDFGNIFTDHDGKTLYYFANDVDGSNNCTGGCANNWPIFYAAAENLEIEDPDFDIDLFGSIETDAGMQSTYNGWPLYYFANDNEPGDVNGDGANNIWYVAKPDYDLMVANGQLTGNNGTNYIVNEAGEYVEGNGNTRYFVDFGGNTLYAFANDAFNESNFGGSEDVWARFRAVVNVVPSIMDLNDFGIIANEQVSFRGNPLYFFGSDESRGDTKGVSVPNPGVWPVVNDGTVALTPQEEG
ncbi:MAG: fasciclin domain-containing protein [Cyclobacteriaceae bacterium]|nr:fasciclin domain-containing protein [Cyclobacteriaceae bacterium]